jgi:hypothetical protein
MQVGGTGRWAGRRQGLLAALPLTTGGVEENRGNQRHQGEREEAGPAP